MLVPFISGDRGDARFTDEAEQLAMVKVGTVESHSARPPVHAGVWGQPCSAFCGQQTSRAAVGAAMGAARGGTAGAVPEDPAGGSPGASSGTPRGK